MIPTPISDVNLLRWINELLMVREGSLGDVITYLELLWPLALTVRLENPSRNYHDIFRGGDNVSPGFFETMSQLLQQSSGWEFSFCCLDITVLFERRWIELDIQQIDHDYYELSFHTTYTNRPSCVYDQGGDFLVSA